MGSFVVHFKLYKLSYGVFDVLLMADYISFVFSILFAILSFMIICSYGSSPPMKRMFYYGFCGMFLIS